MNDKVLATIVMVKNEEKSIALTINSVKDYTKNIVIFDTGSTDKTIDIIKETCKKNKQILHLTTGEFKSFPESRNDLLTFSETLPFKFLLMMDAGDEFNCKKTKKDLLKIINDIPSEYNFGLVKQTWLDNTSGLTDHFDIRLVRNHQNCRYDPRYPVHEKFQNLGKYVDISSLFFLYQDRIKYGIETEKRYRKDIELLLNAFQCKRNFYFLAQSYMSINDFKNGFKYNVLSIEKNDVGEEDIEQKFTYVRAGFCAIQCGMNSHIIFNFLTKALNYKEPPVDAYIYILKYCIENNLAVHALPYLKPLYELKKPDEGQLVNHEFYDYTRWHLLSVICLISGKELEIGKKSCEKAILARNKEDDKKNIRLFNLL